MRAWHDTTRVFRAPSRTSSTRPRATTFTFDGGSSTGSNSPEALTTAPGRGGPTATRVRLRITSLTGPKPEMVLHAQRAITNAISAWAWRDSVVAKPERVTHRARVRNANEGQGCTPHAAHLRVVLRQFGGLGEPVHTLSKQPALAHVVHDRWQPTNRSNQRENGDRNPAQHRPAELPWRCRLTAGLVINRRRRVRAAQPCRRYLVHRRRLDGRVVRRVRPVLDRDRVREECHKEVHHAQPQQQSGARAQRWGQGQGD